MNVTLIDHMGTDLSVVNAARVSFAKKSEMIEDSAGWRMSDGDKRLIKYLAKHNHWTPFGHTAVTLHIKAPLFVARQLGKHQVGLVWNEVSRRYVDEPPEFYEPHKMRLRAENVKQGSSDEEMQISAIHAHVGSDSLYADEVGQVLGNIYENLIRAGVAPEQARMVLPQSMMTEWYWTGSIAAFSRVYALRIDSHTQRETQEVAKQIGDLIKPLFPHSWEALTWNT